MVYKATSIDKFIEITMNNIFARRTQFLVSFVFQTRAGISEKDLTEQEAFGSQPIFYQ